MSEAHDQLKAEVADRLERNTALIAKKRQLREELRLEIAELREAIETDERLDRALNPKPRNTAKELYGDADAAPDEHEPEPDTGAPAFQLQ